MNFESIVPHFELVKQVVEIEDKTDGLGERQKLVYLELKKFKDGLTAKELAVKLHNEGKVMFNERNSVHPRLNELIKLGLVTVIGKKTCQYTDKKVTIYKVK